MRQPTNIMVMNSLKKFLYIFNFTVDTEFRVSLADVMESTHTLKRWDFYKVGEVSLRKAILKHLGKVADCEDPYLDIYKFKNNKGIYEIDIHLELSND